MLEIMIATPGTSGEECLKNGAGYARDRESGWFTKIARN